MCIRDSRYTTEVVGNELTMLDSKNSSGINESQNFENNVSQSDQAQGDFNEDDIPF